MSEVNFYSVDRLVEFGMSVAIAQQMVKSMNETMSNMQIPGSMNSFFAQNSTAPPSVYYAIIDNNQEGPFSETELVRLIIDKKIVKETYVWIPGMKNWQLAENVPAIIKLVALTPPVFNAEQKGVHHEN
ncbi:hypothetical protein AGMMS50268_03460 [Spirochaetia bacterium]|nr:hypothetical protein AGMMS50268_03460 [Spirochaetia bacterium]